VTDEAIVMTSKCWRVEVWIDEHENRTRATARLLSGDGGARLTATGTARCNPTDVNVPEIGEELAAARALSELSHHLLHAAAEDIEAATAQPTHLRL
jgi:hypothetical protein